MAVILLEVGPADGLCSCTEGTPHLHTTTEANIRSKVIAEAAYDPADVKRIALDTYASLIKVSQVEMTEMFAPLVQQFEELRSDVNILSTRVAESRRNAITGSVGAMTDLVRAIEPKRKRKSKRG